MPEKKIYFPWPNEHPAAWAGVWLESVGRRDLRSIYVQPHPHFYCTHLIWKGRVRLQTINGVDRIIGPGELFSLWPNIGHRFSPVPVNAGREVDMDWIRLRGPQARSFMRTLGTSEVEPVSRAQDAKEARRLMRRLQHLARNYTSRSDMQSVAVLYQLALACGYQSEPPEVSLPLAERVRNAMQSQLESGMNVEQYARSFNISRSALFLAFKKHFGSSPVKVLNEIRLERARTLLAETDLPIRDIAVACGDTHPLYFSNRFRRAMGKSPSEYREIYRRESPE